MNKLRYKTPQRRNQKRKLKNYSGYKGDLREDFNQRCGYCDDLDTWKNKGFQIDHFIPKNSKHVSSNIADNDYSNLVYSCAYCNRAKWDKWPTGDENKPNDGKVGFIDPCDNDYTNHLDRNEYEEIIATSELGNYMRKALKLYLSRHAVIRHIERLDELLDKIESLFKQNNNAFQDKELRSLIETLFKYREYTKFLRQ